MEGTIRKSSLRSFALFSHEPLGKARSNYKIVSLCSPIGGNFCERNHFDHAINMLVILCIIQGEVHESLGCRSD
jgi:hypothetical protein